MADPFHVPFAFHRDILREFAVESGLLVMGRGLGIDAVLRTLVHLYADPRVLVLVLSAEGDELLGDVGDEDGGVLETSLHIGQIKADTGIKERGRMYERGGVVVLSTRVLLMDLLHARIPVPLITGVLVTNAHRVTEYGMEAFCLHLLRRQNEAAFIKAFSDNPEWLIRGFSKAEKILRTLRLSNMLIYPRFHAKVLEELGRSRINAVEIGVALTQRMRMLQVSILGILETAINDICKDNGLDTDDFNVDLSVLAEFDSLIQQSLESNWHRVGFKTKQLLREIRVLRNMLSYSLDYDAAVFHGYLQTLVREAQGVGLHSSAYWLLTEAANVLVEVSRDRATTGERNPKCAALLKIVAECETARGNDPRPIVIFADSSHVVIRLAALLCVGPAEYARRLAATLATSATSATADEAKRVRVDEEATDAMSAMGAMDVRGLFDTESFFAALAVRGIVVRTGGEGVGTLETLDPAAVIMYHPNLELLRAIEMFKAHGAEDKRLPVYFFMYTESVEEQRYLASIRREKEAFEQLIRTKAVMAPYTEEAGVKVEFMIEDVFARGDVLTDVEFPKRIVVDVRDLRSSLPFLLHLYGFEIEPQTLAVGDYILSPTMCVERKSLPDLISSLNSGRLHAQATAMTRTFACCILLIEFDPDKPFYLLQSRSASALRRTDLSPTDLISKLVLLLLHHPTLKLLWTSGPKLTCNIFYDLKRNEPNPELEGNQQSQDTGSPYSERLKDFLLKLPGVNAQNYYLLMRRAGNLKELATLSLPDLTSCIGIENGTRLFGFFSAQLHNGG